MIRGMAASGGVGIGKAVLLDPEDVVITKKLGMDVEKEKARFREALEIFTQEIRSAAEVVRKSVGNSEGEILSTQIAIIQDPELTREVFAILEDQKVNVEYAFGNVCDNYIALFSALDDELISARSADFQDIKNRLLSILMGVQRVDLTTLPEGSILVADDISPSQAAAINPAKIYGIITRQGTKYSHISIISRALQLPTVVAVGPAAEIDDGDTVIVDGDEGTVICAPHQADLKAYKAKRQAVLELRSKLEAYRLVETRTADGHRVELCANLALPQELKYIVDNNVDGIGLFRTELLFLDQNNLPGEERQFQVYKYIAKTMGERPSIIRTLDIGGDKSIPHMRVAREENPNLGFRGIRFCLAHTDIFKRQLSALLRAGVYGNIKIMLPMVSYVHEVRSVKQLIREVADDLKAKGIPHNPDMPLGITIETPAAAIIADVLAREVDFFSIGTNDLTQYVVAVDRNNQKVANLYTTFHPAVLRLVQHTLESGIQAGIQVSICGEAAADPLLVPYFVGAGITSLSVNAGALLRVRRQINNLSKEEWTAYAKEIVSLDTANQVASYINAKVKTNSD